MRHARRFVFLALAVGVAAIAAALAVRGTPATPVPAQAGRIEVRQVDGASLAGNTLGIPTTRRVSVYLPPSYDSSPSRDQETGNCPFSAVRSTSASSLPSARFQRMSYVPNLLEENATRSPSGVQTGRTLSPSKVNSVSVRRSTSKIQVSELPSCSSTHKATRLPSGERRGVSNTRRFSLSAVARPSRS